MPYAIPKRGSSLFAGPIFRALRIGNNSRGPWGHLTIMPKGRFLMEPKGTNLAALPATCEQGELAVTQVTSAARLYICSAANTWTLVGSQA